MPDQTTSPPIDGDLASTEIPPLENETGAKRQRNLADVVTAWTLPIALAIVLIVGFIWAPPFRTAENFRAILLTTSLVGIVAVGMTPITMSGNFVTLASTQSTMLASVAFLSLFNAGLHPIIAVVFTLILCLAVAGFQGLVVASGLNPVVTTLAAGAVIYGLATIYTGAEVVTAPAIKQDWLSARFLGLPFAVYLFILVTIVWTLVMDRTKIGRETLLVGSNRRTAALNGVQASKVAIMAFLSFGAASAIGGMMFAARIGQTTSNDFREQDLTFEVVAAVLVGGTAIQGGSGSPWRAAVGAIIVQAAKNIMLLKGFSTGARFFFTGLLVAVVVGALQWLNTRGTK